MVVCHVVQEEPVLYDEHGQPIPYEEAVYLPDCYDYSAEAVGGWSAPDMYNNV